MFIHVRYVLVPELLRNRLSLHQQHFHLLILILTSFYLTLLYWITKGVDMFRNHPLRLSTSYSSKLEGMRMRMELVAVAAVGRNRGPPAAGGCYGAMGGLILHLFVVDQIMNLDSKIRSIVSYYVSFICKGF